MDFKVFFFEFSNFIDFLCNLVEFVLRYVVGGSEMDCVLMDGCEVIVVEVY